MFICMYILTKPQPTVVIGAVIAAVITCRRSSSTYKLFTFCVGLPFLHGSTSKLSFTFIFQPQSLSPAECVQSGGQKRPGDAPVGPE